MRSCGSAPGRPAPRPCSGSSTDRGSNRSGRETRKGVPNRRPAGRDALLPVSEIPAGGRARRRPWPGRSAGPGRDAGGRERGRPPALRSGACETGGIPRAHSERQREHPKRPRKSQWLKVPDFLAFEATGISGRRGERGSRREARRTAGSHGDLSLQTGRDGEGAAKRSTRGVQDARVNERSSAEETQRPPATGPPSWAGERRDDLGRHGPGTARPRCRCLRPGARDQVLEEGALRRPERQSTSGGRDFGGERG